MPKKKYSNITGNSIRKRRREAERRWRLEEETEEAANRRRRRDREGKRRRRLQETEEEANRRRMQQRDRARARRKAEAEMMGRKCCVPFCNSNYNTCASYTPSFTFPKETERRELWIRSINRSDFTPSPSAVVCVHHFEEKFIIREDRVRRDDGSLLVVPRKKLALTSDAYPTVFPQQPSESQTATPPERTPQSALLSQLLKTNKGVKKRKITPGEKSTLSKKKDMPTDVVSRCRQQSEDESEDEWDIFGKSLAAQFKGLDKQQAIIAQKLMSDVMFHAKLGQLTCQTDLKLQRNTAPQNFPVSPLMGSVHHSSSSTSQVTPQFQVPSPHSSECITPDVATTTPSPVFHEQPHVSIVQSQDINTTCVTIKEEPHSPVWNFTYSSSASQ